MGNARDEEGLRGPAVTPPFVPDPARLVASKYAPAGPASLPDFIPVCTFLLDAAGLFHAQTPATWRVHPVFGHSWGGGGGKCIAGTSHPHRAGPPNSCCTRPRHHGLCVLFFFFLKW